MEYVKVLTKEGAVRGVINEGIATFKSIPYAEPPVGNRRWKAPVQAKWEGVLDATKPSPTAPQRRQRDEIEGLKLNPLLGYGWEEGESYLTLNIWSNTDTAVPAPVMFFIHGGSFSSGAGSLPIYDGTSFAKKGIVLVTINYRLGCEGFLPLEGADKNIGLKDQIAALHWVQRNIAAFGGDPGKVTIFGESAGAMSVNALLCIPSAKGLFHRAISQSGNGHFALSPQQGETFVQRVANALGVSPTRESFMQFSPSELVDLQKEKTKAFTFQADTKGNQLSSFMPFAPMIEEGFLSQQPITCFQENKGSEVDLMLGYTQEEGNFFTVTRNMKHSFTRAHLSAFIGSMYADSDKIITYYEQSLQTKEPADILSAVITDTAFKHATYSLAKAYKGRTYLYEFAWKSPALGGALGACHTIELPFVFNNLEIDGLKGKEGILGEESLNHFAHSVQDAWIAFAKEGSPGWNAYHEDYTLQRLDIGWDS